VNRGRDGRTAADVVSPNLICHTKFPLHRRHGCIWHARTAIADIGGLRTGLWCRLKEAAGGLTWTDPMIHNRVPEASDARCVPFGNQTPVLLFPGRQPKRVDNERPI
jgi:hypothetical protein